MISFCCWWDCFCMLSCILTITRLFVYREPCWELLLVLTMPALFSLSQHASPTFSLGGSHQVCCSLVLVQFWVARNDWDLECFSTLTGLVIRNWVFRQIDFYIYFYFNCHCYMVSLPFIDKIGLKVWKPIFSTSHSTHCTVYWMLWNPVTIQFFFPFFGHVMFFFLSFICEGGHQNLLTIRNIRNVP